MTALHALMLSIVLQQTPARVCYVRHYAEARYRVVGYDHIVHIVSECDFALRCLVRTNVNPDPVAADVPPRAHVEVFTWIDSPSRIFNHAVICGPARVRAD